MSLDWSTLREIAGMTDDVGVLSIYVNREPQALSETASAPWELRMRQQLGQLQERLRQRGPRDHWRALVERVDELAMDLNELVSPISSGRGAALFAQVARGGTRTVSLQVPLVDKVVLEPYACVRPLMAAWSAAGAAGVVTVSAEKLRFLDLRLGQVEIVGVIPYLTEVPEQDRLHGPAGDNPALPQQSVNQRDLYERREIDKLTRFLRGIGPQVTEHIRNRGWEFLVITGDPELVQAVKEGLPRLSVEVITLEHPVNSLPPAKVATVVEPALTEARQRQQRELADRARSNALAANTGATGLGETLGALREGRVDHLLMAADGEWIGSRGPDGFLVPEGEVAPMAEPADMVPEPHLDDRMIEMALQQGARVTVLEPPAAEPLAEADGIGALLRW